MRKISIVIMVLAVLLVFTACDTTPKTEEPVSLFTGTMGGVEFQNADTVTLTTEDGKNYTAVGNLTAMTAEQATAFGGVSEGALYISVKVNGISETNPVKEQGWVNAIDSTDYKVPNNGSTKVGKILAISTDATTIRPDLEGCYIWKVVLTDGNVYTLNLSSQAESLTSAAE